MLTIQIVSQRLRGEGQGEAPLQVKPSTRGRKIVREVLP